MERAKYDLDRYHARRAAAIRRLGGRCVDCGATDDLEFDHVDPTLKAFNIGAILLHGDAKVNAELRKCVLRCAPCHGRRTAAQQAVEHGGGLSGKKNCKCAPCKAKKAEYMRTWKRAHSTHARVAQG